MQVYEDNIGKYDQPKETYFDLYLLNLNYIPYDTPILSYDLPEYNIVFIPQNHEMYHMDETEQCLNEN